MFLVNNSKLKCLTTFYKTDALFQIILEFGYFSHGFRDCCQISLLVLIKFDRID